MSQRSNAAWKRTIVYGFITVMACAACQPRRPLRVVGESMAPTYRSGEWLWTLPRDRALRHGDVVVINSSSGTLIKRVVLLPGDRHLQFRTALGWIELLDYGLPCGKGADRVRTAQVPEGYVFVVGDHLSQSIDSRSLGLVAITDVKRIVQGSRRPDRHSEYATRVTRSWVVT